MKRYRNPLGIKVVVIGNRLFEQCFASSIQEYLVLLPPLPKQAHIVARVAQLRRLCAELRQRLTQSQTTQSALAEALVSVA